MRVICSVVDLEFRTLTFLDATIFIVELLWVLKPRKFEVFVFVLKSN